MSTNIQKEYGELLARCKNVYVLQSAMNIVYWDMQTKMPPAGVTLRGQQVSLLQVMLHKMVTDPAYGKLVDAIIGDPATRSWAPPRRETSNSPRRSTMRTRRCPRAS